MRGIEILSSRAGAAQTLGYYDPTKDPQTPEEDSFLSLYALGIHHLAYALPLFALYNGKMGQKDTPHSRRHRPLHLIAFWVSTQGFSPKEERNT